MHTLKNKYSLIHAAVMQIRGPSCVLLDEVHLTGCQPGILHCCAQPLELRKNAPGAGSSRVEGFKGLSTLSYVTAWHPSTRGAQTKGKRQHAPEESNGD